MLRNKSHGSKRRSPLVPVTVVAGLFTLVAVIAIVAGHQGPAGEKTSAKTEQPPEPQTPNSVADRKRTPKPAPPDDVDRKRSPAHEGQTVVKQPAKRSAADRRDIVTGHLAAGEFGPALAVASKVTDLAEKTELLKRVADAQWRAGETRAAARTLRRIPLDEERRLASQQHAGRWASAAGGSGADFGPLTELIKNETSGPWFDIEGIGGTISNLETGVRVDPNGLLSHLTRAELNGRLKTLGLQARTADLNENMARPSRLRLVSLTRLEKEVSQRLAEGKSVVETMKNLAGLYKIEYVFVFPNSGEIVIGGPASGWRYNETGQPVAVETGQPTLQLDDFVTVLRTFSPEGNRFFNCLIVPRQEGLKKARAIGEASRKRGPLSAGGTRNFRDRLTKALGLQDVRINGVPAESRVARVIVDADYRMKLIGIDKLNAGRTIPSYFDLLAEHPQKNPPALDALRWWLTMKYDAVVHSEDRNVFQIQGSSVLCQGLNEKITPSGQRIQTGKADPINRMFAVNFTNHYAELAKRDPVFADLQNIFDLSLVAALIRKEKLDRKANWSGGVFAEGGSYHPETYEPIKSVMSVSNHRVYNGKDVVIQVAGGVRGDVMAVLRDKDLRKLSPRLGSLHGVARAPKLPQGRWWWDVKTDAD